LWRHNDHKMLGNPAFSGLDDAFEVLIPQESVRPPKAACLREHRPTSREC
jgi:hypothetical protein